MDPSRDLWQQKKQPMLNSSCFIAFRRRRRWRGYGPAHPQGLMAPVPLAPMMPHSAPERFDKKGDDDDSTKGGLLKVENTHTHTTGLVGWFAVFFCLFRFLKIILKDSKCGAEKHVFFADLNFLWFLGFRYFWWLFFCRCWMFFFVALVMI